MSPSQAILAGAALIAVSVVLVNGVRPAIAQQGGPYQLMHHSNPNANAGVFRIDTGSGQVSYCFVTAASDLACSQWVK
jgi:hypothetical protein